MTASPLPPQHQNALRQALALHQAGRVADACRLYRQLLGLYPDRPEILTLLGTAECQSGNARDGAQLLGRAVQLAPGQPNAHHNLGNALMELGRFDEALASFDQAVALRADHAEAWFSRGTAARALDRPDDALASYDRALALEPGYTEAWLDKASVLQGARRLHEALAAYDRALSLEPGLPDALNARGNILTLLGRFADAVRSYDEALAGDASLAEAWSNRGTALRRLGRLEDALASCDRALALQTDYAEAAYTRGLVLEALGRWTEAAAAYDQAMMRKPDLDFLPGQALYARLQLADWRDFDARRQDLADRIAHGRKAAVPFIVQASIDDADRQRAAAAIFAAAETPPTVLPPLGRHSPHDRIRLAYFSSDFKNHPVAHLLAGILERHDRNRFEVFAFALAAGPDEPWRRRIEAGVDRFLDVSALSDLDIARLARTHEIDVAVDLNGWTEGYRAGLFAERTAPVQVGYLGYLGSTGAPGMDYILADEIIIPDERRGSYSEAVAYLPCYQVNDRLSDAPGPVCRADLGLPDSGFVFCAFNQAYKITPEVFDSWMRILAQAAGSVLWLYVTDETAKANLRAASLARGVASERLIFADRVPLDAHLARQTAADLFLDTHPYNAGATASSALRAGLPVLTRIGDAFPARMGASLLHAVGLPELIAPTVADYEALAVRLATQPEELARMKRRLAENLPGSILFDPDRGARALEDAFTAMHQKAQAGLPPSVIRPR